MTLPPQKNMPVTPLVSWAWSYTRAQIKIINARRYGLQKSRLMWTRVKRHLFYAFKRIKIPSRHYFKTNTEKPEWIIWLIWEIVSQNTDSIMSEKWGFLSVTDILCSTESNDSEFSGKIFFFFFFFYTHFFFFFL